MMTSLASEIGYLLDYMEWDRAQWEAWFRADGGDAFRVVQIAGSTRVITPKTMVVQSVTHEIRHWAQLATLLRLAGRRTGTHDFLLSGIFERRLGVTSG